MTPEAARTAALRAIGGVEQRKEECRDTRGVSIVENLLRDLRLAIRQLRKQPGFTVHRDRVARARHRRQHRDLPAAERAQPAHAAGARAARARRDAADRRRPRRPPHRPQPADLAAAIRRAASAPAGVLVDDRVRRHALQSVADRRSALRRRTVGVGQLLRDARRHAGGRPTDRARRRCDRAAAPASR